MAAHSRPVAATTTTTMTTTMRPPQPPPMLLLLCLTVLSTCLLSAEGKRVLRDTNKYPACLVDEDCLSYHKLADHACFQYFCYPFKRASSALEASAAADFEDIPPCSLKRPCPNSAAREGGAKRRGERQFCQRHYDKRRVSVGVCLGEDTNRACSSHDDCSDAGGKCCNNFCCGQEYYDALKRLPCTNDIGCQVRKDTFFF